MARPCVGAPKPDSSSLLARLTTWSTVLTLLLTPFVLYGAVKALGVFSNDIRQWLPNKFKESAKYDWFLQTFGMDEMVVVSWEGCRIDDPRVAKLARDLEQLQTGDGQPVFARIVSGPEVFARLQNEMQLTAAQAEDRIRGLFIGVDGQTTCLLAVPTREVASNRTTAVSRLVDATVASTGLPAEALHLGGPTVDGAAIDRESKLALRQFLWVTLLVVFGLTWFRKRSLRLAMLIMLCAGYCAAASLAVFWYCGGVMNLTMIMLPTLVLILAVASAVHMVNYFLKAYAAGGLIEESTGRSAGVRAIRAGGYPIFLCTLTTAIGMGSLMTSSIRPVRDFGLFSAIGVMLSLPPVILTVSWVLNRSTGWLTKRHLHGMGSEDRAPDPGRIVGWLTGLTDRLALPVVVLSIVAMVVVGWGINRLEASVKIQNRFARSTRIIQDYLWLEQKLGPLVPMEVVIRFPNDHPRDAWGRMKYVQWVENQIRRNAPVTASWSAATFRPNEIAGNSLRARAGNDLVHDQWDASLDGLKTAGLVAEQGEEQLWRISLRIAAMNDLDYGELLDQIEGTVDMAVASLNEVLAKENAPPATTLITGGIPMMYKAQRLVFSDLLTSFCTAFLLIAGTMMLVLRGFFAGLIAMLPNILPPLLVFGWMGWSGTPIEIGSVMTASVALGISVDDTIHFLAYYRKALKVTGSRRLAVRQAYAMCSRSMIDATLICGLGVAPFMFSSFMPTVQFAKLMLILLVLALVGDLVQLPAILNSWLGRFFGGRIKDLKSSLTVADEAGVRDLTARDESTVSGGRTASASVEAPVAGPHLFGRTASHISDSTP